MEAYTGPTLSPDTIVSLSQAEIKEGKTTAPKRFTEDELNTIIKEVISEVGATTVKDMGKVMPVITQRVNGRADGSVISNERSAICDYI